MPDKNINSYTESNPVSFIIPCYNCESTLDEAIQSIINLGLKEYEICAIDDCSSDLTFSILEKYHSKYPQIVSIGRHDVNKGGAITRNDCVKMSKYHYVVCLDSDNVLHKESFLKLYSGLKPDDKLVSFGKMFFFVGVAGLKIVFRKWLYLKEYMEFNDLRCSICHPVASGNYLFTRDLFDEIGGYETDLGALDAYSFGYKTLYRGYKIKLVPGTWYYHRVSFNSYWKREDSRNNNNLKKLLLRFPTKFSTEEIEKIKSVTDVNDVLIKNSNDFSVIVQNFLFSILSKIISKTSP